MRDGGINLPAVTSHHLHARTLCVALAQYKCTPQICLQSAGNRASVPPEHGTTAKPMRPLRNVAVHRAIKHYHLYWSVPLYYSARSLTWHGSPRNSQLATSFRVPVITELSTGEILEHRSQQNSQLARS